ncbi:PriCT-2 domain-containing protein [Gammaproteobacteria bacterium AS21]
MSDFKACTEDDVREALDFIHGDDRETWILIGCAIKNEFGNNGFDLWDSWSALQAGYNKKQIIVDWKAIKAFGKGGSVTIATLFKLAIDGGYEQRPISEEEQKSNQIKAAERAKQRAVDEEKQRAHDEKFRAAAAAAAVKIHRSLSSSGDSPYLFKKQVKAYGLGFVQQGIILFYDELLADVSLIFGQENISDFFKIKDRPEHQSFLYIKPGVVAVPMINETGTLQNLQFIFENGGKKFIKGGVKSGCWTRLGLYENAHDDVVIAEGYSTAASVHEATGLTVYMAFDAGNLWNVAQVVRKEFANANIIFTADDDRETEAAGKGNPGRDKANTAAKSVGGLVVCPDFMLGNNDEAAA